jgi:hypothetical protein
VRATCTAHGSPVSLFSSTLADGHAHPCDTSGSAGCSCVCVPSCCASTAVSPSVLAGAGLPDVVPGACG